ncbi:MAG TPA: Uma2 family endonuclease [Verrucomicrobiales bacterium]|jgi:Uma2 family endonuclease|nr:Uma2 family endonuclease [Verrucomicrobiales bacterium]
MHSVLDHPALRDQVIPLTVEMYHALGEMGMVQEKTELIQGFVFAKMPKSPRHFIICQRLLRVIWSALQPGLSVRQEQPITFGDSEPEPDIAVVRGPDEMFAQAHPSTAALVIEVSINSLDRDLEKAGIYAAAGVEEYWMILPGENAANVYTLPGPAGYASVRRVEKDGVLVPGVLPQVSIRLEELLA